GLDAIDDGKVQADYPRLAAQAMAAGVPGSSAGGEFPKFITARTDGRSIRQVLVKFSGNDDSPSTRRWADLLTCEHLASIVVASELSVAAATSHIHRHAGRTFLEVYRFDRHGELGRSGVVSLTALKAALVGAGGKDWHEAAALLARQRLLGPGDVLE